MKLLMDTQIFDNQKFGGISRYYAEFLLRLNSPLKEVCPLEFTNNFHIKECFPELKSMGFSDKLPYYFKGDFSKRKQNNRLKSINYSNTIKLLKAQDFDVFIPTYYDCYFLEHIKNKPFVITIYDMIHELMTDYITQDAELVENKKRLIEKATKVIAISKSTKNDILNLYPHIEPDKIEVVYLSESIKETKQVKLNLPKKFVLFVGNREQYKNFNFFVQSMLPLMEKHNDLYIVCAGGGKFRKREIKYLKQFQNHNKILQYDFKDYELIHYYSNAICFVFPSMYEGFGIPVLEAMKAGCPVILANHSSFPEVAEQAALYFDLNDKEDLKDKINRFIEDENLREDYKARGVAQASKFSWDKTTDECIEIYKSVI